MENTADKQQTNNYVFKKEAFLFHNRFTKHYIKQAILNTYLQKMMK